MSTNAQAPGQPTGTPATEQTPVDGGQANVAREEVVDLDKLDAVMFQGHKYTPEELARGQMRQTDYTRKTQELAQERKFFMNLSADLETVAANPELEASFRETYPPEFHRFLRFAKQQSTRPTVKDDADDDLGSTNLPREVLEKLKRIDALEQKLGRLDELDKTIRDREAESVDKHLDSVFTKLSDKFPYAIEDTVLNKAQALVDANRGNPRFRMTEAAWERLFRQSNDEHFKRFETRYKSQVADQIEKSKKGSDSAPGGAAPGQQPKRMTIQEAARAMDADLRARNGTR